MSVATLIFSLDFELHWGLLPRLDLTPSVQKRFLRTRELIPWMLEEFSRREIRCTWSTVGMLMAANRAELLEVLPAVRPDYANPRLDPYRYLEVKGIGRDEREDPYHFAPSLVARIAEVPGQTIGTHTFSHYYCHNDRTGSRAFCADLESVQELARRRLGAPVRSLVFPRNQVTLAYRGCWEQLGISIFRSNPDDWFWRAGNTLPARTASRAIRLLDHYLPLGGGGSVGDDTSSPSDRFFRPFHPLLDQPFGQRLKLRRIREEMTRAAREGNTYHLWWHPHNLGTHSQKNLKGLLAIMDHFSTLRKKYGMQSRNMEDMIASV